jgi:hypothetical protein
LSRSSTPPDRSMIKSVRLSPEKQINQAPT